MSKEKELLKRCLEKTDVDFDEELANEIEALLAEPEEEPIYIVGLGWQCDGGLPKDGTKLYTSPTKREPLSDDKLNEMADKYITDEACAGYFNGFRDAEKEYGIGE